MAEQIAYEKAMRDQKLRFEVGRAKKEATFYADMINRSRNDKEIYNDPDRAYKQRSTEETIKKQKTQNNELDEDLLMNIFK